MGIPRKVPRILGNPHLHNFLYMKWDAGGLRRGGAFLKTPLKGIFVILGLRDYGVESRGALRGLECST